MNYEAGDFRSGEPLAIEGEAAPRSRRRMVAVLLGVAVVVIAIALIFGRGGKSEAPKGRPGAQLPSVTVIAPGRQTVDRVISATGTLAARRDMPVGVAGEGGRVTRVLVEPGQWVGAGQVLATVDRSVQTQTAESLAASIRVAEADATLAQANLDRAKALVANGFVSRADIDTRTAARDAATARVRVARAQLGQQRALTGRLDIRAPAAGLVLTRQVEPGQVVSGGSGVLFRIAQGGELELRAQLAEADLVGLRPGARATVRPVGSDQRFTGSVWQVSPVIDPQSRQGTARVAVKYDPALRPGGFAAAEIVGGAGVAPLLPQSAIQSDDKGSFVYIVDKGGTVQRRDVKLAQVSDTAVAIQSGLDGTEHVVRSAGGFLAPGQKVKPILQKAS